MHRGWIRLWRRIEDYPHWKRKPFDFAHAWIWLVLNANHKGQIVSHPKKHSNIKVERGQLLTSEIRLAETFGWSRNKLRRYFSFLKSAQQIEQHTTQHYSIITVLNYEQYQGEDDTTHDTTLGTTKKQHSDNTRNTNKNDKKEKNDKKNINIVFVKANEFLSQGNPYKETPLRKKKIASRLKEFSLQEILKAIENCAADEFLQGNNDRGKQYGDLDYVIRSTENIEKLLRGLGKKAKKSGGMVDARGVK